MKAKHQIGLNVLLYFVLSQFVQEYLIAGSMVGVYAKEMTICTYGGCELTTLYHLPFLILNLMAFSIWGYYVNELKSKTLIVSLIPFWISYFLISKSFETWVHSFGFEFISTYTIDLHGTRHLLAYIIWDAVFAISAFCGSFYLLNALLGILQKRRSVNNSI